MDPLKTSRKGTEAQDTGIVLFSRYKEAQSPSDVLTNGGVSHLELPEAITSGSVVPVIVRHVNSPAKFWINLVGPWFSERLDVLYREMEEFYEAQHENYYLPSSAIKPGQFCVCLYAKKWVRAKILEVVHTNLVGVFFIDFGGTVFVTNDTLRFMHKSFTVVPIQCFRGCLPGVKGKNSDGWSSEACEYFRKEVSGKMVHARVERLFKRTYALSVELLDDDNRSIADLMIIYGLAVANRSNTTNETVVSEKEQHEQGCSSSPAVSDTGDSSYTQATAQNPPQVKATSSQEPTCIGNRIVKSSDITYEDVTIGENRLLLVTINSKLYFVFSEFVFVLAGLHEHVALQVLASLAEQLPLWKLDRNEVMMFMNSLEGRSVAGLPPFRYGVASPAIRLLPLSNATEVLNLLHVDHTYKHAVSTFVSSVLQVIPEGIPPSSASNDITS